MRKDTRIRERPGHKRDSIRVYLRRMGVRSHSPLDDCGGCHKVQVIRELVMTCKGDVVAFRFFLRLLMEAKHG